MCSALGPLEYPLNGYVSGCIQRQAFVTFKHSHQGHTKKSKISGRPNRRFFSSLGYCVLISRHRKALFQNGLISLFSEQNLAFKRPFCRCFGIALKHSMDTTGHVFCSRSIGVSFERVCFRLHPQSSLCYLENIPKPKDYIGGIGAWPHGVVLRIPEIFPMVPGKQNDVE